MEECLKLETKRLIRSWMRHDRITLRDYLIVGVQDPRINIQSILTRHFLIKRLFGERYDELMEHELRFSMVMNWLLKLLKKQISIFQLQAVLDALLSGCSNTEDLEIPSYISETFNSLALPNYICDLLSWAPVETTEAPIPEYLMSTFQAIWREVLITEQAQRISVLEPACGSANDYRFIENFGIAGFLDYTGFDLCKKNIINAKRMFADICFKVDNVLEINEADDSFDYCFVHDLFEHLSIDAMEVAISEICRVTRHNICVGLFNMHDGDQHVVNAVDDYYWNKLSVSRTKAIFECYASEVQVIGIDSFLASKYGCCDTHNKGAYMFIIKI